MEEDEQGQTVTYIHLTFHNQTKREIMVVGDSSVIEANFPVNMTINKQVSYFDLLTSEEVVIKQSELADYKINFK